MCRWTIVAIAVMAWVTGSGLADPMCLNAQDVVYTRQPRFRIPYHSDPAELQRLSAREVRLYCSVDRGLSWNLSQKVPPATGRFSYDAPTDGEYWFAVRTLDGANQLQPPGSEFNAGLKVVVDTQSPDLMLSLDETGGQVRLNWRASDVNLDPATLRLEFRQLGMDNWQQVHVVPQAAGTTAWTAPSAGKVTVRGQIQDRAGNAGTGEAELNVGGGNRVVPARPVGDMEGPIASHSQPSPDDLVTPFHLANDKSGVQGHLVSSQRETPSIQARRPISEPVSSSNPASAGDQQSFGRIVNSRSFNLNYDIQDVGPSGVAQVEFFITDDGGTTWYRYGTDPDLKSPFRVDVPKEGTYGFQVRVKSGVGLMSDLPRAGDSPSVVVTVDETAPVVKIDSVGQLHTDKPGMVSIHWKVNDAHPAVTEGVDLEYAMNAQGPWTSIAQGVNQAGSYDWPVQSIPAAKLFVRVTARDAAGNIGHAVTSEPVIVDMKKPVARITDVAIQAIPANGR